VHLASERGELAVAADGEAALAAIRRNPPDLLLLDLQMPKVDGFEVLRTLRGEEATRRLPVIVITGREDVIAIDRAFAEGATSFLVKPINWRLLAYQIRFVHRSHRMETSLLDHIGEIERTRSELETTSAELVAALRGAAAASEAKSQFLAAMSHELRTPLNAIIGFSQVLDMEAFGPLGHPRYREYVRDIGESGGHLLSLINDVLELSRAEAGQTILREEQFTPCSVVDEAVRMVAPQIKARNLHLTVLCDSGLPLLRADRRRVRQVLINLLSNAAKFTDAGGAIVIRGHRDAGGLSIVVRDTGIGIAPVDIAKALDRFGQVDSRFSRKYEGAGLGLPLSREFMELHGGRLELASEIGVGTVVTVTFPSERLVAATTTARA
jgi:signal transduction histidine kinase